MNMEARTASDKEMINRVGMTAAGLASAAQLIDVTPFMTIRIDQSAVFRPLVIIAREPEGLDAEPVRKMFLTADDDPVLAQLWDNDDDDVFDSL